MGLDTALSILLIFCAACYFLLGARLIMHKQEAGSTPLGVLFVIVGCWVMGGGIELLATSFTMFTVGRTGHFIGTALVPVVACLFFREYTGSVTPIRSAVLLFIIPLVSIVLAATNAYHEFMWLLPHTSSSGEFLTRPDHWGPWFLFVHLPYSYALIGAGLLTLAMHSSSVAPAQRRGLFLMLLCCSVPLATAAAYNLGVGSNTISFVPFAFVAMLPAYAWLIIDERIIEFSPLAYQTVFQNMQDPVVVVDDQNRVIGLNHTAENMLSVAESDALRIPLETLLGDEAPEVFVALESGKPQKMLTNTGRFLHVQTSPITKDKSSVRGGQVLIFRDVSDVEKAQLEVQRSENLLRTLIDQSVNGIIRFRWTRYRNGKRELQCIFANASVSRFLSINEHDLVGCTAQEIISRSTCGMEIDEADDIHEQFEYAVRQGRGLDVEVRHCHNCAGRWLRMICEPVGDDFAMTFVDITDGKAKERQMESMATSDPLTGVLNRRGFERNAAHRLSASTDDATGALLFIDLNDFKRINDDFGHEIGDQLLTVAAKRLRESLRSCDIIGRPGGDEFVALVPDVDDGTANRLAKRLAEALEQLYRIGGRELYCSASIGLALYPKSASTLTGLMREADGAMYRAKARSRGATEIQGADLLEIAM